jgi:hypothetical protein
MLGLLFFVGKRLPSQTLINGLFAPLIILSTGFKGIIMGL